MGAKFHVVKGKLTNKSIADLASTVKKTKFVQDPKDVLSDLKYYDIHAVEIPDNPSKRPKHKNYYLKVLEASNLVLFGTAIEIETFFRGLNKANILAIRAPSPTVAYWTDLPDEETEETVAKVLLFIGGVDDMVADGIDAEWENMPVVRKYESKNSLWLDDGFFKSIRDAINVMPKETYAPFNEL